MKVKILNINQGNEFKQLQGFEEHSSSLREVWVCVGRKKAYSARQFARNTKRYSGIRQIYDTTCFADHRQRTILVHSSPRVLTRSRIENSCRNAVEEIPR